MTEITTFWQVAGVLLGFQVTAFTFRLNRELQFEDRRERWFPLADCLNLLSMLITVLFVFLIPIVNRTNFDIDNCYIGFGIAMILFVFYPIALVFHYDLHKKNKVEGQKYATRAEKITTIIALIVSIIYLYYAW